MNKYRDSFLDDTGVELLDKIIAASGSQPVEALKHLDRMIEAYPRSPQLWVSKSIITPSTDVDARRKYCEKAIDINYQFYNGWYFLAKNQRLSATTYCSSGIPSQRLKLNQELVAWIQANQNTYDNEDDKYFALIRHFAAQDSLFTDNWQQWYKSAVGNEEFGLTIAQFSYSPAEIKQFNDSYQARNAEDVHTQKFWIIVELMQTFGLN